MADVFLRSQGCIYKTGVVKIAVLFNDIEAPDIYPKCNS